MQRNERRLDVDLLLPAHRGEAGGDSAAHHEQHHRLREAGREADARGDQLRAVVRLGERALEALERDARGAAIQKNRRVVDLECGRRRGPRQRGGLVRRERRRGGRERRRRRRGLARYERKRGGREEERVGAVREIRRQRPDLEILVRVGSQLVGGACALLLARTEHAGRAPSSSKVLKRVEGATP